MVETAHAPRSQDHGLGGHQLQSPRGHFQRDHAQAPAVLHREGDHRPFLIYPDARFQSLFVEDLGRHVSGHIVRKSRPRPARSGELGPGRRASVVPGEGKAHAVQLTHDIQAFPAHRCRHILVRQVVAQMDRLFSVLFPGVSGAQGGINSVLEGNGIATGRINTRDERYRCALAVSFHGSPDPCDASADHYHIVHRSPHPSNVEVSTRIAGSLPPFALPPACPGRRP